MGEGGGGGGKKGRGGQEKLPAQGIYELSQAEHYTLIHKLVLDHAGLKNSNTDNFCEMLQHVYTANHASLAPFIGVLI